MKLLINAGPTRESIDPVRFLTNRSTGKMGYALAAAAVEAGHEVTLVSGPVALVPPRGLAAFVQVETAAEMAEAMKQAFPDAEVTILCAAVADYCPKNYSASKLKKQEGDLSIELERTEDIALSLGKMKRPDQILAGFAAETEDIEQNALKKLRMKNFDWIAANQVGVPDSGFASDTNRLKLYSAAGEVIDLGTGKKTELARTVIRVFSAKSASEKK
ncbi:MAG: Coenzyme A biosynthesis bifunctional protein CoaBC [Lentisphaerae bacterium ADurb.Bin242]|nr:MAG: Coenzyme A biosynthesis bifunctional protein CoaBC [Lentisphaerae bacterium ADurb.Bin242]